MSDMKTVRIGSIAIGEDYEHNLNQELKECQVVYFNDLPEICDAR